MNSSAITKLAIALVRAQAEMPKVVFDAKNPFLKNDYASLGAIIDASRPVLSKHGLAIMQFPTSLEGRIGVRSVLIHESGESMEDTIYVVPETSKGLSVNQSAGVSITYLRRYSWAAILGLVTEKDTDGDAHADAEQTQAAVKKVMERTWSLEQMEAIVKGSGGSIMDYMDASTILDTSALPEDAPVKTVASWFKHYLASNGSTMLLKAADANEAYQKAKKAK
jgi:ERF superfamily protein